MTFIALDSEKLGERDDDKVHVDFVDNKFQHYSGEISKHTRQKKLNKMTTIR